MWEKGHRRRGRGRSVAKPGAHFTSSISFFPLTHSVTRFHPSKTNRFRPHFMDPPPSVRLRCRPPAHVTFPAKGWESSPVEATIEGAPSHPRHRVLTYSCSYSDAPHHARSPPPPPSMLPFHDNLDSASKSIRIYLSSRLTLTGNRAARQRMTGRLPDQSIINYNGH